MVDDAVQRFLSLSETDAIPDRRYAMLAHMLSNRNWNYDEFSVTILTVVSDSLLAVSQLFDFKAYVQWHVVLIARQ